MDRIDKIKEKEIRASCSNASVFYPVYPVHPV
jgi:hypothetical protein